MEKIEVTIQEIQMATRPNVYKNRKKYTRKKKHKKDLPMVSFCLFTVLIKKQYVFSSVDIKQYYLLQLSILYNVLFQS